MDKAAKQYRDICSDVYPDFRNKLLSIHSNLSSSDLNICLFIKMNFNTNEICFLTNQNLRTIENKRYRLRVKLGLSSDHNLNKYIIKI